jgi:uncharacterized membrane protein YbhN (UPF0104 family)
MCSQDTVEFFRYMKKRMTVMDERVPQPKNKKGVVLSLLKWVWLGLVVFGTYWFYKRHQIEIVNLVTKVSIFRIILSLLCLLSGKVLIVLLVQFSIQAEGWHQSFYRTIGIYGITSIGKYIPGGVWHFVGRIGIYRLKGFTPKQISRSLILENCWLLSSAVVIGAISVLTFRLDILQNIINLKISPTAGALASGIILLLWTISLIWLHHWMSKHTKEHVTAFWKIMVVGIILWLLIGLSFYLIFPMFEISKAAIYIGGYALSWVVGYIAVFAPGGLGVREIVLAWMFTNIAPVETIAVYAAMNRIIWLIAELLYGLVGFMQKDIKFSSERDDLVTGSIGSREESALHAEELSSEEQGQSEL